MLRTNEKSKGYALPFEMNRNSSCPMNYEDGLPESEVGQSTKYSDSAETHTFAICPIVNCPLSIQRMAPNE